MIHRPKIQSIFVFALIVISCISCIKDRTFSPPSNEVIGPGGKGNIQVGTIVVNEFMASGSPFDNELNKASDWFELYNTTLDTITLEEGKWYASDSLSNLKKFKLPEVTLLPRGFTIIWADGADTVISQIHTNFSLNKDAEQVVLYYDKGASHSITVNQITYGVQQSGKSYGRQPDGSSYFDFMTQPTPGLKNKQ
jgi:hypothetical protein